LQKTETTQLVTLIDNQRINETNRTTNQRLSRVFTFTAWNAMAHSAF